MINLNGKNSPRTILLLIIALKLIIYLKFVPPVAAQLRYAAGVDEQVKLAVYYESLCPNSHTFISSNLKNIFNTYKLNVRFIPFGKAHIQPDGSNYRCQHGPLECTNNIIQACTLETLNTSEERLSYVGCAMTTSTLKGQQNCIEIHGRSWKQIMPCANGHQGIELTIMHGTDTLLNTNGPTFIPTAVFNGKFESRDQMAIHNDDEFKAAIHRYEKKNLG